MARRKKKGGGGKKQQKGKAKTEQKKRNKVIEDKTFGMKNKNKSRRVQRQVEMMKKSASGVSKEERQRQREREARRRAKQADEAHAALLRETNKVVIDRKPTRTADGEEGPSICQYFLRGLCTKGNRCKFSHETKKERRQAKRAIYEDERDGKDEDMTNWTEEELRDVVNKRHGNTNQTSIVCRYFIKAIEERKYGWFWECPNGGKKCKYRHALPPGFVLKSVADAQAAQEDEGPPLEEIIEAERAKITNGTPVTAETFAAWKERKRLKSLEEAEDVAASKREQFLQGKKAGLSGRDLFEFNPDAFVDDASAATIDTAAVRAARDAGLDQGDDDDDDDGEQAVAVVTTTTTTTTTTATTTADAADGAGEGAGEGAAAGEGSVAVQANLFAAGDEDLESSSDDDDDDE